MSADLSAFFAKKNAKGKKNAVKMEDVGQIMERRAKKSAREEHDREMNEVSLGGFEEDRQPGEESEWIEYDNSNPAGRLDGLNIKDMGAESENAEEEQNDMTEQKEQHETRTWGQVDKKEDKDVQTATEMAAYQSKAQAKSVFVPSALREQRNRLETNIPDVTSQEMFPSIADANKMESAKKEEAKTGGGWIKTGQSENRPAVRSDRDWNTVPSSGPPSSGRDREAALAALKQMKADFTPAPTNVPVKPAEEPAPKKNVYVPPNRRNQQN